VCPWWLGYFLLNPLRKRTQNPHQILAPYVREGMTVLEPGPGMGFFTPELARLVGEPGRVICIDVQSRMIGKLKRRLAKLCLNGRVDARVASEESMGLDNLRGVLDFTLAFAVVHEFPDARRFFVEVAAASKAGATLLLAEPKGHVKESMFDNELHAAAEAGFVVAERPLIRRSHTALLKKA
jgi:SAM-dependent methyltransferase